MRKMIFVSAGRCGTKRLFEVLSGVLPDNCRVIHQMRWSRLGNVVGNLLFYELVAEKTASSMYRKITSRYDDRENFICTDPLTSMIVPEQYVASDSVSIVHILRDSKGFSQSMLRLSRQRLKSRIAHNLVPLWQPGIWPLENLLNRTIAEKYNRVNEEKNRFLEKRYSSNPNYKNITVPEIFQPDRLQALVNDFFELNVAIQTQELTIRSNETTP